jgi:hypothetical protein
MIPIENTKRICRIGEGCLYSSVSSAGFFLKTTRLEDDYGVDFEILKIENVHGRSLPTYPHFLIQLKSTTNWEKNKNNEIVYDLEVDAYNLMTFHNKDNYKKLIIVLMCLDKNENNQCCFENEQIIFQNSLYWFYTNKRRKSKNKNTVRIKIPSAQLFNKDSILELINTFGDDNE